MSLTTQPKVCAVVVTYNRYKLLVECLQALIAQTYSLDILVLDNASTDGTPENLEKDGLLPKVIYHRLNTNLGGAGGFSKGVEIAQQQAYEFIWLMDDDAEPALDALELLMKEVAAQPHYSAYANKLYLGDTHSTVLPLTGHGHRGVFDYKNCFPSMQKPIPESSYHTPTCEIDMASFVGVLVPMRSVNKIGLPRADFFIHHDDVEYSLRLSQLGKILMVNNSIIYHKEKRQEEKISRHFLIFKKTRIRYDKLWIKYFGLRNSVYLARKYNRSPKVMLKVIWEQVLLIKDILIYDDKKWTRVRFAMSSFIDGMCGNFDNQKPTRILRKNT